ncbi:NUDIX domain-containing protein [Dactylosporangium cerinum]|uniref:NUDIX domain-containing protein n=1 Tax=Dactylosporangium cerinum TaxID=1434730 RepID=A0ABV9VMW0_9ACTN
MAEQLAVGAVVRRGKDVLLVSETLDGDLVWALPGGAVGPGEPLLAKVAQEAGFTAVTAERLLWIARYTAGGAGYEMFGFEVTGVGPHDGSGEWVPLAAAVERLGRMWFAPIREPAVGYLTGRARVATVWTWAALEREPVTVPPVGGVRSA